jgi:hypothetical protein
MVNNSYHLAPGSSSSLHCPEPSIIVNKLVHLSGPRGCFLLPQRVGLQWFLEKGPSFPARGLIPQVPYFRRMPHFRYGEETGHLLHSIAKD